MGYLSTKGGGALHQKRNARRCDHDASTMKLHVPPPSWNKRVPLSTSQSLTRDARPSPSCRVPQEAGIGLFLNPSVGGLQGNWLRDRSSSPQRRDLTIAIQCRTHPGGDLKPTCKKRSMPLTRWDPENIPAKSRPVFAPT